MIGPCHVNSCGGVSSRGGVFSRGGGFAVVNVSARCTGPKSYLSNPGAFGIG